jgi:hypothetical protein
LTLGLVLCGLLASVKLSGLVFAVGFVALIGGLAVVQGSRRQLVPGMTLAAVLGVGMLANNALGSGYPCYPSTVLALPVDWRVPEEHAHFDAAGIQLYGRQPGLLAAETFDGWEWFPPWLRATATEIVPPLVGAALGAVALLALWTRRGKIWMPALAVLPVYAAIGAWFVTAPSYRFVGASLWLAGAIPLALFVACDGSRLAWLLGGAFVLVAIAPPGIERVSIVAREPIVFLRRGTSPVPVPPMTTFSTQSGLELQVPSDGELTWDAPLPATPQPDPYLRTRCAYDLACGFITDAPRDAASSVPWMWSPAPSR